MDTQYLMVANVLIEDLELGVRAYNICKRHNINTWGDLAGITVEDVTDWAINSNHVLGPVATRQIIDAQETFWFTVNPVWRKND